MNHFLYLIWEKSMNTWTERAHPKEKLKTRQEVLDVVAALAQDWRLHTVTEHLMVFEHLKED